MQDFPDNIINSSHSLMIDLATNIYEKTHQIVCYTMKIYCVLCVSTYGDYRNIYKSPLLELGCPISRSYCPLILF